MARKMSGLVAGSTHQFHDDPVCPGMNRTIPNGDRGVTATIIRVATTAPQRYKADLLADLCGLSLSMALWEARP